MVISTAFAGAVIKRDSVTAAVNFSNNTGTPQHLASGLLYGVPDTLNQIPVGDRVKQTIHASAN